MPSPRLHEHLVEDTIDQVRAGTNVVLTGLPGSGRTAVLRRVGDLLDDAGYRVLRLRGVRALRDRPLEALAVSALGADRPGRGASLLATYVAAIGASSASGRLAVVVDDADDLDLESVGALAAAWANHPFAVVASTRVEAGPSERSLADAVGPVVRLGALASAAVSTSAEPALALYRDASGRGIPLLAARALGHAMRLLRAAGDDHGADGLRARAMSDGLPRDLLATMGDPASRLTVRERQVVGLVEDGLSNQQVAHRLRIAVSTVENHLHHAYRKLDVPGRDALVARASSSRR